MSINATAVGATAPSFAAFYPSDADRPVASNLNYGPGQAATPNKVDVKLSVDGKVSVYNAFGQVDMIADVTGYYTNATINELSATIDQLLASQPFSVHEGSNSVFANALGTAAETVLSVDLTAPVAGTVVADYVTIVEQEDAGETVECQINATPGLGSQVGLAEDCASSLRVVGQLEDGRHEPPASRDRRWLSLAEGDTAATASRTRCTRPCGTRWWPRCEHASPTSTTTTSERGRRSTTSWPTRCAKEHSAPDECPVVGSLAD